MDKIERIAGRDLFYHDLGVGIPVMLVHGFAEDGAVWDEVAERLSTMCRVLVPDLPGSGRSALLAGGKPDQAAGAVTMESLAAVLKELLDKLEIDQCVLIGHSMGGYITLAFAEKFPERVRAFGFFHSTAYSDSEEKKAGRRKSIEFIRQHGAAPYIRQSAPNLFAVVTREKRPGLVEEMIRRYSTFSAASLMAYLQAMMARPERLYVLENFPRPILFIIGEQDQVVPLEQALKQAHLPRVAQVQLLADAGHMGMLEDAADGSMMIQQFVNFISLS
ncbi:MAG TPA: alpha/beta fold hydrolase [Puia sp.]|nr:alpha/beta fold hydrolase [Puia sp.]